MAKKKIIVVGGGAAGFFGAINTAIHFPESEIILLEKSSTLLGKVKVSGGGRCNVTHACFEAKNLVNFYPRGKNELLSPFHQFMTGDTVAWFEARGVKIKKEADGRMFPVSNSSQTIIDCFLDEAARKNIKVITNCGVTAVEKSGAQWKLMTTGGEYIADAVLFAAGSSEQMWKIMKELGHTISAPVPSLFTFNINDPRIKELMGLSVERAIVTIGATGEQQEGPLLITHWGMSGPAILKSSAWAAVALAKCNYKFTVHISWNGLTVKETRSIFQKTRDDSAKKLIGSTSMFGIPTRLWKSLCDHLKITDLKWASSSNKQLDALAEEISNGKYEVNGKSTFKEEFVTCGGIELSEVDLTTMQSKIQPHIYFAGEMLNIDAVTGGFNFQAAWTTSWIASKNIGR